MNAESHGQPVEILLVEDNPGDVRMTMEALKDGKVRNHLSVVSDGTEAMAFLRRQGKYSRAPRPGMILLDLNLPKMDGRAVLTQIKGDPDLKRIPVIVLTTSRAEEDIFRSYELHANSYVSKPVDFDEFLSAVRAIENFWLTVVELPRS